MKEISPKELKKMIDSKEEFQLIDVREQDEVDIATLGGEHIPMADVMNEVARISRDKKVIVHCRSGKRSAAVIHALEANHGFTNLYNLQGGILAYADEVDQQLTKY
jgi:adenylyltransferase/sulfurtransferase